MVVITPAANPSAIIEEYLINSSDNKYANVAKRKVGTGVTTYAPYVPIAAGGGNCRSWS